MQGKCWVNSGPSMASSSFAFWNFLEFSASKIVSIHGWLNPRMWNSIYRGSNVHPKHSAILNKAHPQKKKLASPEPNPTGVLPEPNWPGRIFQVGEAKSQLQPPPATLPHLRKEKLRSTPEGHSLGTGSPNHRTDSRYFVIRSFMQAVSPDNWLAIRQFCSKRQNKWPMVWFDSLVSML